ncbi:DUF4097 family beta strand repeat-containing protein [Mucilaginibacter pedocola]|uniref:Adhesin domain-containing protein n=1 Tax=Mucilaginibacter pedocola TaxID=1792845 RepID=A0A1S9P9K4_9SPHI|nr:hypothetical protein [Mucilaginibacter pedocola]OOQ57599.1 hypothetical protein BC343_12385 [Mucilaginibacter pedocola]
MELRIFNTRVFALIASIALSTAAFAQAKPVAPVAPQTPEASTEQFDDKAFNKQMADLQKQMSKLQVQMNKLRMDKSAQKMAIASKKFNKEFKEKFKDFGKNFADFGKGFGTDFGKNFSGSFNGMVPGGNGSFSTYSGSFNSTSHAGMDSAEYREKVASGEISEKVKNYSKSYSVDANDLLQISNSFGRVTVNTWNKNEFKVDVQMKFGSDDEDRVNEMLNGSSIEDSKVGSTVSFRTNLYSGESRRRNGHQNIEINYTVYMPAGNPINIENKFGAVSLPELSGKAFVKVSYGALTVAALTNSQNDVDVRFGDASISNFNNGRIEVAYGKLKAGTVNNIDAEIKFGAISIDRLKGSADVSVRYGDGFRIGTIDKSVKNINVDAQFTKINLDFRQLENFAFDVTTKFGSFNFDDDRVKVTSKSPSDEDRGWSSTKSYKGYVGSSGSSNKIVINASYTGVNFN